MNLIFKFTDKENRTVLVPDQKRAFDFLDLPEGEELILLACDLHEDLNLLNPFRDSTGREVYINGSRVEYVSGNRGAKDLS